MKGKNRQHPITRADEILLLAILKLKDNAYGTTIVKEIKKRSGKELSFGSLWVSLDNLNKRGFIEKREDTQIPPRGGRKKVFYQLTADGVRSLEEARVFHKTLWSGVSIRLKKYRESI